MRYTAANEAMALYASGEFRQRMADFYFDLRVYSSRIMFVPAVNGIQQLRASGGVRMISDRKALEAVQRYQLSLEQIAATQDLMERTLVDFRIKSAAVMDFRVNYAMYADPTNADRNKRWTKPAGNPSLLDPDPVHLNELMNFVLFSINSENSRINRLNALRDEADALRKLIRGR